MIQSILRLIYLTNSRLVGKTEKFSGIEMHVAYSILVSECFENAAWLFRDLQDTVTLEKIFLLNFDIIKA